jgi:hypothetical protein
VNAATIGSGQSMIAVGGIGQVFERADLPPALDSIHLTLAGDME